ncbi:hypothetical protein ACZ90_69980 [Streptomyces albus subsp. albus]|nr:hypothetical protein ACZ90_69980 [Streptomyces albus subsp. albus]
MTACVIETAAERDHTAGEAADDPACPARPELAIAADGSYAARLAHCAATGGRYPERWTLDGPEPHTVPLPGPQPEEPDSEVLPLADGQLLISRRVADRHTLSLLYPARQGTAERPLGSVGGTRLRLLPPAPGGRAAYALVPGAESAAVWLVYGDGGTPRRVAEVPGHCTGGVWLDRAGRLLALDRTLDGRTKTVVVDLACGGRVTPLLQLTEVSEDRLLLADPDSGLLLVRSDAPGDQRLGWGVLGSSRPVRFPDCLRVPGGTATPFAAQPGQALAPEGCAIAFRVEDTAGTAIGLWRPAERRLRRVPPPEGWLTDAGLWTRAGELWLPYATATSRPGLRRMCSPAGGWAGPHAGTGRASAGSPGGPGRPTGPPGGPGLGTAGPAADAARLGTGVGTGRTATAHAPGAAVNGTGRTTAPAVAGAARTAPAHTPGAGRIAAPAGPGAARTPGAAAEPGAPAQVRITPGPGFAVRAGAAGPRGGTEPGAAGAMGAMGSGGRSGIVATAEAARTAAVVYPAGPVGTAGTVDTAEPSAAEPEAVEPGAPAVRITPGPGFAVRDRAVRPCEGTEPDGQSPRWIRVPGVAGRRPTRLRPESLSRPVPLQQAPLART